ncbi:MAG: hypothetical protein QHH15_05110 [Candidatus Thermoplasmatota archaeon]|jgi:hypothetical protein|nr:hypothetical protein [Candidatus Thermoplasmatota archaeon]
MPKIRTFVRTASKSMEKNLIENAKNLMKNPYHILPDYSDNYSNKYFSKIKKSIDKVNRFKDDQKKLEKLSNKKGIVGALAGTLLLAYSEKAPYLGVLNLPTDDITYAQRGKAEKEKLIGIQHFDDPVLRLFAIKDFVLKKKLHVYSWDEGYVSTGIEAKPPKKFIDFIIKNLNLTFKNHTTTCKDIDPDVIEKKKPLNKNYLIIHWKSADLIIAICEDCAKFTKNTVFNMTKYFLEPKISEDLKIEVIGRLKGCNEKEDIQTQNLKEYLSGELTDLEFIKKNIKHQENLIKDSKKKFFILDNISYGKDIDGFIKALKPNNIEKEALEYILPQLNEPVILNNVTPNKVLERFWKDYGLKFIKTIIEDEEMAKKFFLLEDSPSNILDSIYKYKERQKILSKLPKYKKLPQLARFIDDVVRVYKTFGEKEAIMEIKKRPDDPKAKSIAYAFLLVFEKAEDKKWQFSHVEIEYGNFLKEYAKNLLLSKPEDYHKNFQNLLSACGSSENIENCKI